MNINANGYKEIPKRGNVTTPKNAEDGTKQYAKDANRFFEEPVAKANIAQQNVVKKLACFVQEKGKKRVPGLSHTRIKTSLECVSGTEPTIRGTRKKR